MAAELSMGTWREVIRSGLIVEPGRGAQILRMTVCATLVATLFLVYRVPLPAYGAYVVLMACQRDAITSVITSVGAMLAAAVAIAVSVILYILDFDEPALRVPLMAVAMFGAMYFSRLPKVGPLVFLAGFVLVVTQTIIDQDPDPENLTHLLLWLALVVIVPCLLVTVSELFFGNPPARLFNRSLAQRLHDSAARLTSPQQAVPATRQLSIKELTALADRLGPRALALVAGVDQWERIVATLPVQVRPMPQLAAQCARLGEHLLDPHGATVSWPSALDAADATSSDDVLAATHALRELTGLMASNTLPPAPAEASDPISSEAARTAHLDGLRFAFKATLAAMACYILYSAVDWSGIRTCIITCFFVALSSVGETVHKLSLRLTGALIGGVIAGLAIVFLFPVMDTIGSFVVLFALVTAFSAWIATAGIAIGYAGLQIAFAFYLGVLQDYGPTDDLTVLRDRLVGIVLGNVAMSVVFAMLWPVSAVTNARRLLAGVARRLARLLQRNAPPAAAEVLAIAGGLEDARRLISLRAFDLNQQRGQPLRETARDAALLADATGQVYALLGLAPSRSGDTDYEPAAARLTALANQWTAAPDAPTGNPYRETTHADDLQPCRSVALQQVERALDRLEQHGGIGAH